MIPALLALLSCPARPVPGVELLARLYDWEPDTIDELLALQPEIEREAARAGQLQYRSQEAVKRCTELRPIPLKHIPFGF